ncbi:MAG: cytochrome c [Acidobacteriota bacterium]
MIDVLSQLGGPARVEDPTLVFDNSERYPMLSVVWLPGSGGLLVHNVPAGHTLQTVIGRGFDKLTGKEAFERTCRKCHGEGGRGDADADKFFKKPLPRLNSEYVQAMSDVELKAIISQGKHDMPPVRLDTPGVGHLFPLQSLDELVDYLRTLKNNE